MMLHEAVMRMQQDPRLFALSHDNNVFMLSKTGFLMPVGRPARQYARLRAIDLLSMMWQTYTAEQLQEMADQQAAS